jgi:RNA polymerase sigma-70 factor, ECF subfamily
MRFLDPQLLARHTDRLHRAAWALCGSPEEAEDLVQQTYVRVLRGQASDLTYLMCALRDNFFASRRDAARRPEPAGALREAGPAEPRATGEPSKAPGVRELYAAIAGLPEHLRLTLVAIDVVGLSYREASRSLGMSEGTVTTRLFRARQLVSRQFAECAKPEDSTREHGLRTESSVVAARSKPKHRSEGIPYDAPGLRVRGVGQ